MSTPRCSGTARKAKRQLADEPDLIFNNSVLRSEDVTLACRSLGHVWRERLFTPLFTLWAFIGQALNTDSSCKQAVARVLSHFAFGTGERRKGDPQRQPSHDPSAYCHARKQLPDDLPPHLARTVGARLEAQAEELWHGHHVKLVDGSSVSMPDTAANQQAYPQVKGQKIGCGFPTARIVGFFSLVTGALLDLTVDALSVGETTLFARLWSALSPGDVVVGDRYYCTYGDIVRLQARGVHGVFRLHQRRTAKEGRIKRLGRNDWLVCWPKGARPRQMSQPEFEALAESLTLRLITFECRVPGWRTKTITVATTLLDAAVYPAADIARLYHRRWEIETDLAHVKTTLGMDVLSCRSPQMVRKELWTYLLAYNLVRSLMWQAGQHAGIAPLRLSFKAAVQELLASWPYANAVFRDGQWENYYAILLQSIAQHKIPQRPNRCEPRVRKRRPKNYRLMTKPREQYKKELIHGA